jgi:hypothetical protein
VGNRYEVKAGRESKAITRNKDGLAFGASHDAAGRCCQILGR